MNTLFKTRYCDFGKTRGIGMMNGEWRVESGTMMIVGRERDVEEM